MLRTHQLLDNLFNKKRWVIHVLFWVIVLFFYVVFFGRKNSAYLQTLFFVGLLMPITIVTTYFLNYYLVPRYLIKERYGHFLLYFIYTLLGSLFLETMIALLTFIVIAELRIRDMSPASVDIFFLLTSLLMVAFLAVAIKMVLHWRQSKEDYQKLMRDKVEAELKFLKVQLNPHFLFNTLNNLYFLTTEKSDKAPQAILQLSEMLDYVMHASHSTFVPLEEELKQVRNYIALEMLRYEERVDIEINVEGKMETHRMGPMMLITLVENAFKHGVMKSADKSWIRITLRCDSDKIMCLVSNSWKESISGNGIGLENLKSQLTHLYPGQHSFQIINDRPGEFSISLSIDEKR